MDQTTTLLIGIGALITIAILVAAATGHDIDSFERMRALGPKQYLGMKRTLKFNGPLVALMCTAIMIGSPIAVLLDDATVPWAAFVFAWSGAGLWLSVRWTR